MTSLSRGKLAPPQSGGAAEPEDWVALLEAMVALLAKLEELDAPRDRGPSPEQYAEAVDLRRAVTAAIKQVLTPHQRRVVIALLVEEVPIDVLAERFGTTRNALYKTVHDARGQLRAHLAATGYLVALSASEVIP